MAQQQQPRMAESFEDLAFPSRGIDLTQEYLGQIPGTTPTGANVRLYEPGSLRARGGARPGLSKYVPVQPSGNHRIQCLDTVVWTNNLAQGADDGTDNAAGTDRTRNKRGGKKGFAPVRHRKYSQTNITFIQQRANGPGNIASGALSVTFSKDVAAGDFILVAFGMQSTDGSSPDSTVAISDTQSNAYTRVGGYARNLNGFNDETNLSLWFAYAASAGSLTITGTPSTTATSGFTQILALEYANVKNTGVLDGSSANADVFTTGAFTLSTGLVHVAGARELLLGFFYTRGSGSYTAPAYTPVPIPASAAWQTRGQAAGLDSFAGENIGGVTDSANITASAAGAAGTGLAYAAIGASFLPNG